MKKRTWAAAGTAGLLVATTAAVGFTGTASAGTPGPVGTPQTVTSTLTWKTTGTTTAITYSAPKSGQTAQQLTGSNCVGSSATGTQYLTFGVTGPKVGSKNPGIGFKSNTLGVRSGNDSNGTACQQVNTNSKETLSITVDKNLTSSLFGPGLVQSANLDLNLSGNAIVRAELFQGGTGGTLVGKAELQSGFSAPQTPGDAKAQLQICNFSSNSGPQSGFNNNCYWNILPLQTSAYTAAQTPYGTASPGGYVGTLTSPAAADLLYDTIRLTPVVGDFGIQGGNVWPTSLPGSAGTTFTLAATSDGQINCFDGTNLDEAQAAPLNDPRAVLTRLQLGDSSKTCKLKAYDLAYDANANAVTYRQQLTGDQATSQYALVLPRDYAAGTFATASVPSVKVDWEDGSVVTLAYCPAGLITATDAANYYVPTAYNYGVLNPALVANGGNDQSANSTGIQFACVYRQSTSVNGADGKVTVFDYIYFAGDARFAP